jgi:uncharacterized membrane protein
MSGNPVFFFAGVYDNLGRANVKYETIKALHQGGGIGSYDAALVSKSPAGLLRITKTELPAYRAAWSGLAAGAAVAVAAPVAAPAIVAVGGAGVAAWMAHLARGMSRADAREIGQLLEEGPAALVVVGIYEDTKRVEMTATGAEHHTLKKIDTDWREAEAEVLDAIAMNAGAAPSGLAF